MKSSHIYINPQGVPCAPTKKYPYSKDENVHFVAFAEAWKEIKNTAIPIREEDRQWAFLQFNTKQALQYKPDTFYPVAPYEFEALRIPCTGCSSDCYNFQISDCKDVVARIIHTSESKADPKEKELRDIIAEIIRDNVTYSYQTKSVVIHGAIEKIIELINKQTQTLPK